MTLRRQNRSGGCPLCDVNSATCGHPSDSVPFDLETLEVAAVGGPLRRYEVTTPSGVVATMKLNEADAERLGGVPVEYDRGGTLPATVSVAVNDTDEPEAVAAPKKRASSRNKARTAANKEGGGSG